MDEVIDLCADSPVRKRRREPAAMLEFSDSGDEVSFLPERHERRERRGRHERRQHGSDSRLCADERMARRLQEEERVRAMQPFDPIWPFGGHPGHPAVVGGGGGAVVGAGSSTGGGALHGRHDGWLSGMAGGLFEPTSWADSHRATGTGAGAGGGRAGGHFSDLLPLARRSSGAERVGFGGERGGPGGFAPAMAASSMLWRGMPFPGHAGHLAHLSLMDRDFGEADYEMLLQLDESHGDDRAKQQVRRHSSPPPPPPPVAPHPASRTPRRRTPHRSTSVDPLVAYRRTARLCPACAAPTESRAPLTPHTRVRRAADDAGEREAHRFAAHPPRFQG